MSNKPSLFVISAPSGAGKTTLVKELIKRNPEFKSSISYTTREKRLTEIEGTDYLFVREAEFQELKTKGKLLESALVFDNHYGTSRSQVEQHFANGHHVILEIDWQGAQQVRQAKPDCITIFVLPPSLAELERRVRKRGTDSDTVIQKRLSEAFGDMSHWKEFDYVIINDDLQLAITELVSVFYGQAATNNVENKNLQKKVTKIVG
jgi:guanylate kinase